MADEAVVFNKEYCQYKQSNFIKKFIMVGIPKVVYEISKSHFWIQGLTKNMILSLLTCRILRLENSPTNNKQINIKNKLIKNKFYSKYI